MIVSIMKLCENAKQDTKKDEGQFIKLGDSPCPIKPCSEIDNSKKLKKNIPNKNRGVPYKGRSGR